MKNAVHHQHDCLHRDGNQVWFITAGGALFCSMANGLCNSISQACIGRYCLVLFALFLRPVGFDYRSKHKIPNGVRHGTGV